jgi:hypothetical protein
MSNVVMAGFGEIWTQIVNFTHGLVEPKAENSIRVEKLCFLTKRSCEIEYSDRIAAHKVIRTSR